LSHFEYITIFVAIVFGYAVSELLAGIGRLIRQRDQVDFYWVHSGLVIALMVALMNAWWNIWGDVPDSVDLLTV
jgi:hypothetical protein